MTPHTLTALKEDHYYHIYHKGNGGIDLFYKEENYAYFLKKYDAYMSGYVDTYAFCLLPDHIHLLIKVKDRGEFNMRKDFPSFQDLESLTASEIVTELFRRFFMTYSKSINMQLRRKGSLFPKNFKKKLIDPSHNLTDVITYIHKQVEHHGYGTYKDLEYPWSSYNMMLLDKTSKIKKQDVIDLFGSREAYLALHEKELDIKPIMDLVIEE